MLATKNLYQQLNLWFNWQDKNTAKKSLATAWARFQGKMSGSKSKRGGGEEGDVAPEPKLENPA